MKHLQQKCLSCVKFRPTTTEHGVCRLDKTLSPDYPVMAHDHSCENWATCGQQYYIRVGWVKKQQEINSTE